jgi:Fic family protein
MNMKEKIYQNFNLNICEYEDILSDIDNRKSIFEGLKPFCDEEEDALKSYDESFITRYTYDSNTIEGATLSIGDTGLILEGEFVPDKPGREQFAARGIAEGYDYAQLQIEEGAPFSQNLIKDIHERTALDCQPRTRGTYRVSMVYLKDSFVTPVDPLDIRENMDDLMFHYDKSKLHPILKSAAFHVMFENIHPFSDGNGRCGRTILNYMLKKEGYLPVSIKADNRKGYIDGLSEWQLNNNSKPFIDLLKSSLDNEYDNRCDAVLKTREAVQTLQANKITYEPSPEKTPTKSANKTNDQDMER